MNRPKLIREKGSSPPGPSQVDPESPEAGEYSFYSKSTFNHMLRIERHRTERSKRPILLLLIDLSTLSVEQLNKDTIEKIKAALSTSLRETDIRGWSERNRIIGVIFTEMESLDESSIDGVVRKIHNRFSEKLDAAIILRISISYHIYPETKGSVSSSGHIQSRALSRTQQK